MKSIQSGDFDILRDFGWKSVYIRFRATGFIGSFERSKVKKGTVRDPFFPSVFGVGFVGIGGAVSTDNGKSSRIYTIWRAMIGRCYSEAVQKKHPTYIGCSVCSDWHNFQNFYKWYVENYPYEMGDRMCIDKDIKVSGNKVYSPEYCTFVTYAENSMHSSGTINRRVKLTHDSYGVVVVTNVTEFSGKYGLDPSCVCKVIKGKRNKTKGWSVLEAAGID